MSPPLPRAKWLRRGHACASRAAQLGSLFVSFAIAGCRSERPLPPGARALAARMAAGAFSASGAGLDVQYQLFIPAGHSTARRYPLLVFLHGAGSHGADNLRQLAPPLGALIDRAQSVEPTFVLVPQDPKGDKWVSGSVGAPYRNYRQTERPQSAAAALVLTGID